MWNPFKFRGRLHHVRLGQQLGGTPHASRSHRNAYRKALRQQRMPAATLARTDLAAWDVVGWSTNAQHRFSGYVLASDSAGPKGHTLFIGTSVDDSAFDLLGEHSDLQGWTRWLGDVRVEVAQREKPPSADLTVELLDITSLLRSSAV